jgi:hypothetical protein
MRACIAILACVVCQADIVHTAITLNRVQCLLWVRPEVWVDTRVEGSKQCLCLAVMLAGKGYLCSAVAVGDVVCCHLCSHRAIALPVRRPYFSCGTYAAVMAALCGAACLCDSNTAASSFVASLHSSKEVQLKSRAVAVALCAAVVWLLGLNTCVVCSVAHLKLWTCICHCNWSL